MLKLSVIVITLNEERNLARCLASIQSIADEIVILDSFSTDKTLEIAAHFGAKVEQKVFEGYVKARLYVESLAQHDFILAIDADEALTVELQQSILQLKKNWVKSGYYVARKTNYCGKWIRYSGWYPDRKLRLYKKGSGRWEGKYVHEKFALFPGEEAGTLEGDLLHYSYYTEDEHWERTEKYAFMSAQELFEANRRISLFSIFFRALIKFIRDYLVKFGLFDGKIGFKIAKISAVATFKKYKRLLELNKSAKTGYKITEAEFSEKIRSKNCDGFSIIIPTWNNLEYLQLCLYSLRKNSTFNNQIILAINEGTDGTLEWVEAQQDIDFIHSKTNMGVSFAVNACRQAVKADYIVYMNDDMYVYPEWDKMLLNEIRSLNTDYFFLSSSLVEPQKNNNPNYISVIRNYGTSVETFDEEKLLSEQNDFEITNWQGSSWPPNVVHKNIWDLVGGYSLEFYPGFYSDPDFSMKLCKAGVREFYGVGKSKVYHFGERTTRKMKKNDQVNRGSVLFLQKWGMTAKTFYTEILQMGKPYKNAYPDKISLSNYSQYKNSFKRFYRTFW
ncbi:MAG TPA: hypothetical protein DCG69_09520 [Bacteroidales bacterium]|nr:hypothetical protein [Bacteroidales bacterium]